MISWFFYTSWPIYLFIIFSNDNLMWFQSDPFYGNLLQLWGSHEFLNFTLGYSIWALKMDLIQIPRIQIRQMPCCVHETCNRRARHLARTSGYAQGVLTLCVSYVHFLPYQQLSTVDLHCSDPDWCTVWTVPLRLATREHGSKSMWILSGLARLRLHGKSEI